MLTNANCAQDVEVSMPKEQVISCMSSLLIDDHEILVILDDGSDTSVIGNGWEVVATSSIRKAHVIGFDHKITVKRSRHCNRMYYGRSQVQPCACLDK